MHSIFEIINTTDVSGPELVSLDDLKLALGITGTEEDAALQAQITFQSRIIAEYCDRHLGYAEAIETFQFDRYSVLPYEVALPRQALSLRLYPVVSVLEVTADGSATIDFEFDPPTGLLWTTNGAFAGRIAVSYSGGYMLPDDAPARLQKAVIDSVNESRTSGSRDPTIREVAHGDTRVSYFTNAVSTASPGFLSAAVLDLISTYRRLTVG